MTIHIVTDSGSDLSEELCLQHDISLVPLSVTFGETQYIDREDIDGETFYRLLSQHEKLPVSAAPSPGQFLETFGALKAKGIKDIIHVSLSENASATAESARAAAQEIDGVNIHVFNTRAVSSAQGTLVLKAAEAVKEGAGVSAILEMLSDLRERIVVFAALNTLENAKKGGRISNVQAFVGSLLSIKPILSMDEEGTVVQLARPRTRRRSFEWLAARIPAGSTDFAINHGRAKDVDLLVEILGQPIERFGEIGPVVGVHGGEGAIALSYIRPKAV